MTANFYKAAIEKFLSETFIFDDEGTRAPQSAFDELQAALDVAPAVSDVTSLRHELVTMTILRDGAVKRASLMEKAASVWREIAQRLEADKP